MTTQRGFIMFSTTCTRCGGAGQVVSDPCETCHGERYVERERKVLVTFPPGIDGGQRLRVPGQGMAGAKGAQPGDLYVDVELARDDRFERDGQDLGVRQTISFTEAALGANLSVELPDDSTAKIKVKSGTQPGSVVTLRGQGMPTLHGGRGDLHVVINVAVPKKVSRRVKKLLEQLEEELGGTDHAAV
jgi:molecular chaperone DnaJ